MSDSAQKCLSLCINVCIGTNMPFYALKCPSTKLCTNKNAICTHQKCLLISAQTSLLLSAPPAYPLPISHYIYSCQFFWLILQENLSTWTPLNCARMCGICSSVYNVHAQKYTLCTKMTIFKQKCLQTIKNVYNKKITSSPWKCMSVHKNA